MNLSIRRAGLLVIVGCSSLAASTVAPPVLGKEASSTAAGTAAQRTATPSLAAESPWPLQVQSADTTLILFQPQVDSWDGNQLAVRIDQAHVDKADFPGATAGQAAQWSDAAAQDLARNGRTVSLERLEALVS